MKMTFENLSKKGTAITVQSATNDAGQTNDPSGWTYPRLTNVPISTFRKLLKECKYEIIDGGFKDGEFISSVTYIQITGIK